MRFCVLLLLAASAVHAQSLTEQLATTPASEIVAQAKAQGDARRGALLFHQPHLQCASCHSVNDSESLLGPNLAVWAKSPD
ncbi:MAG: hypothetical protein AAF497_26095, partial [Planctomycetota bacterium]